ncbi:MAG: glycosyltransferase family 4 protein [Verrucomicrobiae bacterium]|nr:glycosyltransferase family 4 protein [Verrucomicrobiae bacterium]
MGARAKRLVVVPSDPMEAYEKAGYERLERYFNPGGCFEEVIVVSPMEREERRAYGMRVIGIQWGEFPGRVGELQPDAIRAYGGYWPADLACLERVDGIPVVASVHDTLESNVHPSLRFADLVLCVSEAVKQKVLARGVRADRIRVLPNRIDPEIFHPVEDPAALRRIADRFPSGRAILHVGRQCDQKAPDDVIRALRSLPKEYFAVFVGAGDPSEYERMARLEGLSERCFWVESVPNSELPVWYSWCDCMCTPSRWEGFGIVFLEAAACGSAIVTRDIAPMNEYLKNDVSAALVGPMGLFDQSLARAIRKVCEDEAYRAALRRGALEAARPFDRAVVDRLEIGYYEEALALRPMGASRRLGLKLFKMFHRPPAVPS